jgi:heptosyltransferase-2
LRILIIALSGIGDALLFTPAASLIRKNFPDAEMDALVMFNGAKEIYEQSRLFDKTIYHDFLHEPLAKSLRILLSLRKKYDASINVYPANRKEYNVIQFIIGAKNRGAIKYLRRNFIELGFLNNVQTTENDRLHNVQENISLSEKLLNFSADEEPDLVLPLTEKDFVRTRIYFSGAGIKETDTVIGFHAGSATFKNQTKRRWEPQKFAELAKLLAEKKNAYILIFGGPEETNLKTEIQQGSGSSNVLIPPSATILESAALIKRCNAFVTNDSGMMHLASATKTPTVGIIGPTNVNYIHPWHTEYEIASLFLECSPCFVYSPRPLKCFRKDVRFKCIRELTVEMVFQRVLHLLDRNQTR